MVHQNEMYTSQLVLCFLEGLYYLIFMWSNVKILQDLSNYFWVVYRVEKKKIRIFFFWSNLICWSWCRSVRVCVCRGFLTPLELFDFDEIWVVGPVYDVVVPCRYCLLTPLWLPSNGTLKFLKNHKKLIFSKIGPRATVGSTFSHIVKNFQLDPMKTVGEHRLWMNLGRKQ